MSRALARNGWLTMAWPREYGGIGASHVQQVIFKEELFRSRWSIDSHGVNLAGPTIIVHGSEEMKRDHLPRIARAETRWCQGFSEPGAGSDLASLQTRAVRSGDNFVVNGQKVWTSYAHVADWMLLLARTDPDAPKHRGISMFALDMKSPGVSVRPLNQLNGEADFNEVYFQDVVVPPSNLIGELNRGWYAATTTLDFERSGIDRNLTARVDFERILHLIAGREPVRPASRHAIADLRIALEVGQWLAWRVAYLQGQGAVPNYEASISKTFNSELGQHMANVAANIAGLPGQLTGGQHAAGQGEVAFRYLDSRRLTIGQGTSEINRNVIATRGLGLPRG
jgi:alkylation response protein AidB-like acyl-CoA dehydrogenase